MYRLLPEHRLLFLLGGLSRYRVGGLLAKTLKSRVLVVEFLLFRCDLPRERIPFGDRRVRALAGAVGDRIVRNRRVRR